MTNPGKAAHMAQLGEIHEIEQKIRPGDGSDDVWLAAFQKLYGPWVFDGQGDGSFVATLREDGDVVQHHGRDFAAAVKNVTDWTSARAARR